jgi:peptidoglycan/LPS O-acetylase OafA/YrhL
MISAPGTASPIAAQPAHADEHASKREGRLPFIHGLRGVAAASVTLFHLYDSTPVTEHLAMVLPSFMDGLLRLGFLGVDLFFVISGFVISLTLHNRLRTIPEWGRFFLRRQLRLDPPYWTTIALSIVSALALNAIRPSVHAPVPSVSDVVVHLFYLQDFLHRKSIVGIFWSLCFEVQFYLFFGALVLARVRWNISGRLFGWLMMPLYLLSVACFWHLVPYPDGLFISRWFEFFTGVIVYMYWRKEFSLPQVSIYLGLLLIVILVNPATDNEIAQVTAVTVMIIGLTFLLAVESGGVQTWLSSRVLRYLGDISYSLYLMHALVGIRLLKILVGERSTVSGTLAMYAVALVVSIAASDLLFRTIERPSMRLSHRLGWRKA